MRMVRHTGENISPADDRSLYHEMFSDGLFADTTFSSLGANQIQIGAMYGIMQGSEFTSEQQILNVIMPSGTGKGCIYVQFDITQTQPLSFGSAIMPYTPVYDDINGTGTRCQMILAEYDATAVSISDITPVYNLTGISGTKEVPYTLLASGWVNGQYTISSSEIHAEDTIELTYPHTLTDDQYEALQNASTRTTGFSEGQIIIRALSTVPSIDIPIILVIWR